VKKYTENYFCCRSQRNVYKYTHRHWYLFPKVIHRLLIPTCLSFLARHCPSNSFSATASQIPFSHLTLVLPSFLFSGGRYTKGGQNTGNTTDTVHISLLISCWITFCLQYSLRPSWNGLVQVLNSLYRKFTSFLSKGHQVALGLLDVTIFSSF
jgi:hypothetical protein